MKKLVFLFIVLMSAFLNAMTDSSLPIDRPSTIYCATQEFVEKEIKVKWLIYYASTCHFIKQTNNQNNKIDYFGYLILNEYTRYCAISNPQKLFEQYEKWYGEQ